MAHNRGPQLRWGKKGICKWQGLGTGHQSLSRQGRSSPGRATWFRVPEPQQGEVLSKRLLISFCSEAGNRRAAF